MTIATRQNILRANALYLLVASIGGLVTDVLGAFFSRGPWTPVLGEARYAGIGFIEAHGLALILGILLWRSTPTRSWHLTGFAVHALLGTANLLFWDIFITADMLIAGYITTWLHGLFAGIQLLAALYWTRDTDAKVDLVCSGETGSTR
jgi:hypothetical protein